MKKIKLILFILSILLFSYVLLYSVNQDFTQGMISLAKKDYISATKHFSDSLEANSNFMLAKFYYGYCIYESGKKDEGKRIIIESVLFDPRLSKNSIFQSTFSEISEDIIKHAYLLGIFSEKKQRFDVARKIYKKALIITKDDTWKKQIQERLNIIKYKKTVIDQKPEPVPVKKPDKKEIKKFVDITLDPIPCNLYLQINFTMLTEGTLKLYITDKNDKTVNEIITDSVMSNGDEREKYWYCDNQLGEIVPAGQYKVVFLLNDKNKKIIPIQKED